MTNEAQQATNQAQNAENGQQNAPVQIEPQYQLNYFFLNLRRLNKNLIRVANVQLNQKGQGAFIGSPEDFLNVFARSQSTDLLVAFRTFAQIQKEVAETVKDITDPNAITEIRVAFGVGNQAVTASYTLLNIKEAFENHYKETAPTSSAPDESKLDDSQVLDKVS